ncbi:MAG: hypothetical protein P8171_21795 [Candidatus Thiodiazotropha sp.]
MKLQRYESDKNTALAGEARWRRFAYGGLPTVCWRPTHCWP